MSEEKSRISIIYVAFLEYMGVKGSDKWTKEELQAVSSNFNNWWIKNYEPKNISEIQRMESKKEKWNCYDRFILHPELFQFAIKKLLAEELPLALQQSISSRFIVPSEEITKDNTLKVMEVMNGENPTWWHNDKRNDIFYDRFKLEFPKSCEGDLRRVDVSATAPPVEDQSRTKIRGRKNKTTGIYLTSIAVAIVVLWVIYKVLF